MLVQKCPNLLENISDKLELERVQIDEDIQNG